MQNKANLPKALMNVTSLITVDYENKSNWKLGKNKPNTDPIKPNLLNAQMNANKVLTKDYENKPPLRPTAKQTQTNPISNPSFERLMQMIEIFVLRDVASIGEVKFIKAECWKRVGRRLLALKRTNRP